MSDFTKHRKKTSMIYITALIIIQTLALSACFGCGGVTQVTPPENTSNAKVIKPEGKTVADYTSDPNFNLYVANSVLSEAGSFSSVSKGTTVSTKIGLSITQDIYATRVVKGETVYKQSLSYGFVKTGDERIAHGNTYLYRSATEVNSVSDAKWSDETPGSLTKDEFFNRYGYRGNALTGYILNDETIISSTFDGYDENTGLYSFTYVLDNQKATAWLLYEMRTNSGSTNFAVFEKAVIHVTMDENWLIHSLSTDCAYNVPILGNTPCKESITEEFSSIGEILDFKQFPHYDYFSKYVDFTKTTPIDDSVHPSPSPVKPSTPVEPQSTDVLMSMFEKYLTGSPLNVALKTEISGYDIAADVTLNLDLDNSENITLSALTSSGIRLTYAKNEIFAAINNVKLRSSLSDVSDALKRFGIEMPMLDFSSDDFDPSAISDAMTLKTTQSTATVNIPLSLGDINANVTINGKKSGDFYAFTDATVVIDGTTVVLKAQDKTIAPLNVSDSSYIDACTVLSDYYDAIDSVTKFKASETNNNLINKSLVIEIQPLKFKIDGATYETKAMTVKLYTSQNKIVITGDKIDLTCTAADKTVTKKQLSFSGAYVLPTEKDEGKLYLTINNLANANSDIKISIGSTALTDCFNKRFPELKKAIPQLNDLLKIDLSKDKLLEYTALLSNLTYDRSNDKTLSLTINAEKLVSGAGELKISLSQPQKNKLCLSVNQSGADLFIDGFSLSVNVDEQAPSHRIVDNAYNVNAKHISFDSIDTLLQSLINTAKRKSFRLTGKIPVSLNALSIVKANIELGVDVRIDAEKDENGKDVVYIAAKLARGELSGVTKTAFDDKGGDSFLFYNGKNKTVTIKRNSLNEKKWCTKCNGFTCSNTFLHTAYRKNKVVSDMNYGGKCSYEKTVTEKQFAENVLDYVLPMINFTKTINNAIVDAANDSDKNEFGLDDLFVDYTYTAPTYNIKLNLKPADSVLGNATVHIDHDENSDLSSLYGNITLLDVSGVSAEGTFNISLVASVDGQAKSLSIANKLF